MLKDPFIYAGAFLVIIFGLTIANTGPVLKSAALANLPAPLQASILAAAPQDSFAEAIKNFTRESPQINLAQDNSIINVSSPLTIAPQVFGILTDGSEDSLNSKDVLEYTVVAGDTLSSVAAKFDISLNTILWANNLNQGAVLKLGQKLIILPVSGVVYHVKKGDTVSNIVKTYKADLEKTIAFNELSGEADIFVGDILIIPDGKIPVAPKTSQIAETPIGSSYFICPNNTCRRSQGLHWYNAIDFPGACGSPIYAAAAGTVQRTKSGWNGGAGNTISILHPNGVVTVYGHASMVLVSPGQEVFQGYIIGLIGGQPGTPGSGLSTGCHIHFGVVGARNPFAY